MKLTIVVLPISDLNEAEHPPERLECRLETDTIRSQDVGVVQTTSPSAQYSIISARA